MRFFQPLTGQVAMRARAVANVFMCSMLLCAVLPAGAQDAPQPAAGAACTVSALNRNAPVAPDSSFTIYNIPGSSGPFRARATCSDGSVGQTAVAFPEYGTSVVYTGDIVWGRLDPTPVALGLQAASKQLGADQTAQLVATAVAADASTHDVTPRAGHQLCDQQRLAGVGHAGRPGHRGGDEAITLAGVYGKRGQTSEEST
jgi:hypothetical protein